MVKTVQVAQEERLKARYLQIWMDALREKVPIILKSAEKGSTFQKVLSLDEEDLDFAVDPTPFAGFNDETEEDLKSKFKSTLGSMQEEGKYEDLMGMATTAEKESKSEQRLHMPRTVEKEFLASSSGSDSLEGLASEMK